MSNHRGAFETALANVPEISPYKTAIVEVVDTAYLIKKWFDCNLKDYTSADVVAMTALVLAREKKHEME